MEIASGHARGRRNASSPVAAMGCVVALLAACSSSESKEEPVQDLELTGFCLGVEPNGQTVQFAAGAPLVVHLVPGGGCFSSSCTEIVVSECAIQGTNPFDVTGTIKVRDLSNTLMVCTEDCGGAGTARCEGPFLEAGSNTVRMGDLSVTVDVPSVLNQFERCAPPESP